MTPQERRRLIEARFPIWEVLTISGRLGRAVEAWTDRPLIITDARTWSYAEVQAWSRHPG
jgi:fatty-acyl-CoA synthase